MKVGEAIARVMKAEGMQILCGYPVNHLIEFAAGGSDVWQVGGKVARHFDVL